MNYKNILDKQVFKLTFLPDTNKADRCIIAEDFQDIIRMLAEEDRNDIFKYNLIDLQTIERLPALIEKE